MPKFEFYLNENDFDRLMKIKEREGKHSLTGNEFAKDLLERELHRLHPGIPNEDEEGRT